MKLNADSYIVVIKNLLKNYIIFFSISILYSQNTNLDSLYYSYSEIKEQLYVWEEEFGNTAHPSSFYQNSIVYQLDSIGVSSVENLPIYAVKLSTNADEDHDKAKVLILGQCHAEEIYGVEMSMALIDWLLHPEENLAWINDLLPFMYNLEIWIVPTHNPEGLNVVHGYEDEHGHWQQDISYRKNKTDVNDNDIFDYTSFYPDQIAANDSDGVDLNRNYGLNWFLGDDKYELSLQSCPSNQTYSSNYDYYRGAEPFSEKEIQAIRDFVRQKNFLVSVAYHSSRSGCVSERVIYPWGWTESDDDSIKVSPDYEVISEIAESIASNIRKEGSELTYIPKAQKSRTGNAHDWIYAETGCIQFLIEMGSDNIQPMEQSIIDDTIERNRAGLFYLLHEVAGTGIDTRQITGIIRDAIDGTVLPNVEIQVLDLHGSVLKPRLTDGFGRYRRLLSIGEHTLAFIKEGYEKQIINNISVSSGQSIDLNIELVPLNNYNITFINQLPEFSGSFVELVDSEGYKTSFTLYNEPVIISLYNQDYTLKASGDLISPFQMNFSVNSNDTVYLELHSKNVISDNLVQISSWNTEDSWQMHDNMLTSQLDELYGANLTNSIRLNDALQVDSSQVIAIELYLSYELEWDKDIAYFNLVDGDNIIPIAQWHKQNWSMHPEIYFAEVVGGVSYGVEVGIISDESIGYRGMQIQSILFYGDNAPSCTNIGDLNEDANWNILDIVLLANIVLQSDNFSYSCIADMNQDESVNVLDIVLLANCILTDTCTEF